MKPALAALASILILLTPTAVQGATVGIATMPDGSERVAYEAAKGEVNDVTITETVSDAFPWGFAHVVDERSAPLALGSGCFDFPPIACEPRTGSANLGDRDDRGRYFSLADETHVWGGNGNDDISSNGSSGFAWGEKGNDRVSVGSNGLSVGSGGPGHDSLQGCAAFALQLYGDAGNDRIETCGSESVAYLLDGGPGNDTILAPPAGAEVTIRCGPGFDRVVGAAGHSVAADCEIQE
jgi:Ca2+-binding RTX toxin-like protein